jgi:hypothetical protein
MRSSRPPGRPPPPPPLAALLLLLLLLLTLAPPAVWAAEEEEEEEELEPAREQVSFFGLAIFGVVLAAAIGAGAVWLKRVIRKRVLPLQPEATAEEGADTDAEVAIEVAMIMADNTSRLPQNVRRMLREGTHADLEELCRPGATQLLDEPEGLEDVDGSDDGSDIDALMSLTREDLGLDALDDELLGVEEGTGPARRRFGDPVLRSKLATGYLLQPNEGETFAAGSKVAPNSAMEVHLGLLQAAKLEKLQRLIHGLGDGMDVLIEGPLLKLATVANIQCWLATYVRVWADGRWVEMDDFQQTQTEGGQAAPELDAVPTKVTSVFEVVNGADAGTIPAATEDEPHDAVITVLTGKRGKTTQVYCATDAGAAAKWVSGCETLAKTSILPQPALIQFLEERSLGDYAAKLAELAKIRTVDQLAITSVSDTTLVLVGMNRFKQRIYRRSVREAYKQQSAAAAKAASADVPTVYEEKEEEEQRHEQQKKKIKVTEKARAKKRKEEQDSEGQTLEALGSRLIFDVTPMGVVELRKLMGDSDAKIEADSEARAYERQRAAEKAAQQAKVAESGTLLEGWACESCMHFNSDATAKVCAGCFAPAHLVGGPNMTSKVDERGEERPTTPGGTIISKEQGSVLQKVKQTDEEVAAAKKAHEEREQAEAERKEMGDGRGHTPEKAVARKVKLDTETLGAELAVRRERLDKEKIAKRKLAMEQKAAARAERLTALEKAARPASPRWLEPSNSAGARFGRWVKRFWNTTPWVLRARRRVPLTVPQLPGKAAFGAVRHHTKYMEQKKQRQGGPTSKGKGRENGDEEQAAAGPGAAWDSDSDSDEEAQMGGDSSRHRGRQGASSAARGGGGDDESDDEDFDSDDWWYRYMMKHGTDKIMRRK